MPTKAIPNVLTIAGSDSGGGAGIQADLKSFAANGAFGASVITALTAQNTMGVTGIHAVPPDFVGEQIDAVFGDIRIDAVKIGMLASSDVITAVAQGLARWQAPNVVVDPVMVTTTGAPLIEDEAVAALRTKLFPLAALLTPNLHEAARLTGREPARNRAQMVKQGRAILQSGAAAVLVKGGHAVAGADAEAADVLVKHNGEKWFAAPRIKTANTHGTGCSLSSAIAAHLAHGASLEDAIARSKAWLTGALLASDELSVGSGSGPVHHFHAMWKGLAPTPDPQGEIR